MTNLAIRLKAEPVRTIAFGSIGASYTPVGSSASAAKYLNPIRVYFIQNLTDKSLMFSWDGVNDHFPLDASAFLLIDVMSNRSDMGGACSIAQGDSTYVKEIGGVAPTVGNVYLTVFYAFGG